MFNIIIGCTITFVFLLIPSYLLCSSSNNLDNSHIEKIFYSYTLSLSLLIIFGFVISFFKKFFLIYMLIFLIGYNIFSLFYTRSYKINKKYSFIIKLNLIDLKIYFLFIIMIYIIINYLIISKFPIGWDRGKHFGRMLYTLINYQLETKHIGSYYNPFYFQGPNIIYSIFVGISSLLSFNNIQLLNFKYLIALSYIFKIFIFFITLLTFIGTYSLSINIYKNKNISFLNLIMFISLSGWFINTPSLSALLSFLFVNMYVILINYYINSKFKVIDYIFLFLIIFAIISTHIIGTAYFIIFTIIELIIKILERDIKYKKLLNIFGVIILTVIFYIIFLKIFNPLLFQGIIQEIIRRNSINTSYWIITNNNIIFSHFYKNINQIFSGYNIIYIIIILSLYGIFNELINKYVSIMSKLFLVSLIFLIFPLFGLHFIKPEIIFIYPLCILSGKGLFEIFTRSQTKLFKIALILYLIFGICYSVNILNKYGLSRKNSYDEKIYKEYFELASWINKNIKSQYIVLFPEDGPFGYLLNALSNHTILLADPRYPDLPIFQELSKIYDIFTTLEKTYDFKDVSNIERYEILKKYNISIIIETHIKIDMELLNLYTETKILYQSRLVRVISLIGDI